MVLCIVLLKHVLSVLALDLLLCDGEWSIVNIVSFAGNKHFDYLCANLEQ